MRPEGVGLKAIDWRVSLDETTAPSGTVRLKVLGSADGVPSAQVDVWAADRGRALDFLRGLVSTLESKWGSIVIPRGAAN